jgi:esterase
VEIRNGDVMLHVLDEGDRSAPPVLLLHGITSSSATYDWLVPHLVDDYRVVRLDFRGHGRSGRAPGTYGFPAYVSDAVAVCEQVVAAPCVAVGHSLGGGVAASVAQQRPDLLKAVVLEDPALMGAADAQALTDNTLLVGFQLIRNAVPHLQAMGVSVDDVAERVAAGPSAVGVSMGELVHPDALRSMAEGLLQLDATVLDPVLEGRHDAAFDPFAPMLVPGLVLAADPTSPDAVVRERDTMRLAEHSPLVEVRALPEASHLIHDEIAQRDAYLQAVLTFLAEHR